DDCARAKPILFVPALSEETTMQTRLAVSLTSLAFVIALASGCAQQPATSASPAASPWASPTSTMRWNEYACELIARNQVGQFPAARTLAYLNLAINNAIVLAKQRGLPSDGAAAGAAATVLIYMFPKDEQAIATRLNGEIAAIGNKARADFASGVDIGRTAGTDVVGFAKSDRTDLAWSGPLPEGPS